MKLNNWANKYPHKRKYLITDSYDNVNELLKKEEDLICNLESISLFDFVKNIIIKDNAKNGKIEIVESVSNEIQIVLLNNLLLSGNYFISKDSVCEATTCEVLKTINILRSGLRTSYTSTRIEELNKLTCDYVKELENKGFFDTIMLYEKAISIIEKGNDEEYLIAILDYYKDKLTYIENKFLNLLSNNIEVIDTNYYSNNNTSFYSIYGEYNEIEKVIADINKNNLKLSDISIITPSSKYESIIKSALDSRKIDYKYVSSSSLRSHPFISLVYDLFDWALSDYNYANFKVILENDLINMNIPYMEKTSEYGYTNKEYIYQLGIDSGIGYSYDRYVSFNYDLRVNRTSFFENFKERNLGLDINYLKNDVLDIYLEFLSSILSIFKEETYNNPYKLLSSILKIKVNDNEIKDILDKDISNKIDRILSALFYSLNTNSLKETILMILDKISNLSTSEARLENMIEVECLNSVKVFSRKHIYFLGLSYDSFEGSLKDSPVLTDEELRKALDTSYYCLYSLEKSKEKIKLFKNSINTISNSNIYYIRSNYNTCEFRTSTQCLLYKDLRGDKKEIEEYTKYANLLDLDNNEKFVQDFSELGSKENKKFSFVRESIAEDGHKVYELISPLTASQLNYLALCPLKYVYAKEYFSNEIESRNSTEWLNAMEKGNLYHYVLEDYCRSIKGVKSEDLSSFINEEVFDKIFNEKLEKFIKNVPVPSAAVYEIAVKDMREDLIRYINNLHEEFKKNHYHVFKVEEDFNSEAKDKFYSIDSDGNKYVSSSDLKDELKISFKINTRMDRVDYNENNETYRIVDYKTGSKFSAKKMKHNLQWFVYPYLEGADSFEYHFLCDKTNDDIVNMVKKGEELESIPSDIAKAVYDFLVNGYISFLDEEDEEEDADGCKYCQYKGICLKKLAIKRGDKNGL